MLFAGQIHDFIALLPWSRLHKQKAALREILEQRRRVYDKTKAAQDAQTLIRRITKHPRFQQAKTVMLYAPIHNEIDLLGLIDQFKDTKTILLPVTHRRCIKAHPYEGEEKMHRGKYRVMEPTTEPFEGTIDLILVPGVAFDHHLHRLGRGGGFYDKFLRYQHHSFKLGVGYDFQLRKTTIPHGLLDTRLDAILTPTKSIG